MIAANNPNLKSFIEVEPNSDFPIQNLPFGVFINENDKQKHVGVAIGDLIFDLSVANEVGLFAKCSFADKHLFETGSLNAIMALGNKMVANIRHEVSLLLQHDNATLRDNSVLREKCFVKRDDVSMVLPVEIKGYTDFYASREHATNIGTMFRGAENALPPNWLHIPIGYDGRANSVVVSGTDFHRPKGQIKPHPEEPPVFSECQRLDCELEMGFYVGQASEFGEAISIKDAPNYIVGFSLFNDWSARDIQKWEYQPLGPFLAKNFCSSIAPWVVTLDALEPFKVAGIKQEPEVLDYLKNDRNFSFNIELELLIRTPSMSQAEVISKVNFKEMYWDCSQQLAHHSVNGCAMQTGDLLASGTISGKTPDSCGSFIELTWAGKNPIKLSNGETRVFIEDGDEVILRGFCQGNGYRVGFGEVSGKVLPSS